MQWDYYTYRAANYNKYSRVQVLKVYNLIRFRDHVNRKSYDILVHLHRW